MQQNLLLSRIVWDWKFMGIVVLLLFFLIIFACFGTDTFPLKSAIHKRFSLAGLAEISDWEEESINISNLTVPEK